MHDLSEHDELRAVLDAYWRGELDVQATASRVVALTYGTGWSFFASDSLEDPDRVTRAQALAAAVERLVLQRLARERQLPRSDPGTA